MINFECCYGCPKRYPGCSGKCPDYKKKKAALEAEKQMERIQRRANYTYADELKLTSNLKYRQALARGGVQG